MAATTERRRRPRGSGSIRWRRGRPYAVYRHALTGKQTWVGCDSEEQADAFLAQWAADRKAARMATKAALLEREARAPQRRPASSSQPWTFGQLLSGWEERHRGGVQESTMREYRPGLNDLRRGARRRARAVADRRALRGLQARQARRHRRRRARSSRTRGGA
jgi:hypothetical protein